MLQQMFRTIYNVTFGELMFCHVNPFFGNSIITSQLLKTESYDLVGSLKMNFISYPASAIYCFGHVLLFC